MTILYFNGGGSQTKISLHITDCPGTQYVDQVGLPLLELKARATNYNLYSITSYYAHCWSS